MIRDYNIEEAIIAIETSEHNRLKKEILNVLFDFDQVLVKIIPDMYDIMLGSVKMNHVFGAVLIEIEQGLMPKWQRLVKRMIDVAVSVLMLTVLPCIFTSHCGCALSSPLLQSCSGNSAWYERHSFYHLQIPVDAH